MFVFIPNFQLFISLFAVSSIGVFPLTYSDSYSDYCTDSDSMQKCSTGTNSDGDSYAKSQWKLVKFHLIGTDISAKMGTVAIGIGISACIGIGIGSLETLLHIIIAIFIRIGIGINIGIGVPNKQIG